MTTPARTTGAALPRITASGCLARIAAWFTADEASPLAARPSTLRSMSQRVVTLARSHPAAVDAALAGAVLAAGLYALSLGGRGNTAVLAALEIALALPLIWRRRYPLAMFTITGAAALAQWLYAERTLAGYALLISVYSVARHAPRRVALTAAAVAWFGAALAAMLTVSRNWPQFIAVFTTMVAAPCFLGSYLRTREAYLFALVERNRRLEHERDQQARLASAAERASIAREMHDIVAHSLAVIITMAEAAAAKRRSDPDRAAAAMEQVAETGRQALDQTRRLLGVLRTSGPAANSCPLPGLAQLDALLEQVRSTGLAAELTVTGRRFPLAEGPQLAIYRIIQEALTNTLKHARGATRVQVLLTYDEPSADIRVADDGQPAASTGRHHPGHGIAGMHERAALYGGDATAGPRPGGGWMVTVRLSAATLSPVPAL